MVALSEIRYPPARLLDEAEQNIGLSPAPPATEIQPPATNLDPALETHRDDVTNVTEASPVRPLTFEEPQSSYSNDKYADAPLGKRSNVSTAAVTPQTAGASPATGVKINIPMVPIQHGGSVSSDPVAAAASAGMGASARELGQLRGTVDCLNFEIKNKAASIKLLREQLSNVKHQLEEAKHKVWRFFGSVNFCFGLTLSPPHVPHKTPLPPRTKKSSSSA